LLAAIHNLKDFNKGYVLPMRADIEFLVGYTFTKRIKTALSACIGVWFVHKNLFCRRFLRVCEQVDPCYLLELRVGHVQQPWEGLGINGLVLYDEHPFLIAVKELLELRLLLQDEFGLNRQDWALILLHVVGDNDSKSNLDPSDHLFVDFFCARWPTTVIELAETLGLEVVKRKEDWNLDKEGPSKVIYLYAHQYEELPSVHWLPLHLQLVWHVINRLPQLVIKEQCQAKSMDKENRCCNFSSMLGRHGPQKVPE
jgi:hypothetical protein